MNLYGIFIIGALVIVLIGAIVLILKNIPSSVDEQVGGTPLTTFGVSGSHPPDVSGCKVDVSGAVPPLAAKPYATDEINSVDDYEYNLVFKNEGDKAMTKKTRDVLMSAYPMDWSTQPPSSELFQQGLAAYKEGFQNKPVQKGNPYREVDGSNMIPPDSQGAEDSERDILATYVPKKPGELTTYDLEDAEEIVKRIYTAKGLIPYTKRGENNTVVVMSTTKIGEEIVYEDEYVVPTLGAPTGPTAIKEAGEGNIEVPVNMQGAKPNDPFFTPVSQEGRTRDSKWDYTSWTPGLERTFAPTEPQTKWY
jgi:hypothetical protein